MSPTSPIKPTVLLPTALRATVVACCSLLALASRAPAAESAQQSARWDHIRTALYCTSEDVDQLLTKPEDRKAALEYFAPLRLSKFYLQSDSVDQAQVPILKAIAADLRAHGYEVAGALVASDRGPLCYNNEKDMALLEARVSVLAQVYDEFILDDWLFTNCTCAKCLEGRGNDSWADYRSRLVAEQSKRHIIDAAKKVHPGIRVTIKYPNWYEGHRYNGYDVARQTPQFDGVSVGIETRQRASHDQHIPIYSGYVFQEWLGGDAGTKWRSAWLDNYGMEGADNDYVAQVWQAVLARTPEIIFWCAGQLHPPVPAASVYPHLVELMPDFDRLAGLLVGPSRGIPIHLPIGSVGEYNIFGHFGMIGLPMAPSSAFPTDSKTAIFTQHSHRDPNRAAELLARVHSGREVFLTWPLMQALKGAEVAKAFNVIGEGGSVSSSQFRVRGDLFEFNVVEAGRTFTFPKIQVSTWPDVRDVGVVREDSDSGVLLRNPYLEGQVDALNLPENTYDLQRLPEAVLNSIRSCFFDELGVRLVGQGGVALYPFGQKQFVLYNMDDTPAKVSLRFPAKPPVRGWKELMHGKNLVVTNVDIGEAEWARHETDVAVTLRPFEIVLIESE